MDSVGVFAHVRRDHARIDGREAAAHVDDVHDHARAADRTADLGHSGLISGRPHTLRTDVERHAHQAVLDGLARGQQQGRSLVRRHAELARQRIGRAIGRDGHADDQVQVGAAAGGVENLVQFVHTVQREGADAVIEIGLGDRRPALDRMHEGQAHVMADRTDQFDLGDGGHVEAANAGLDQGLDDPTRRVRLHSVEDVGL